MAHWTEELFKDGAGLYVKDLEARQPDVPRDSPYLAALLAEQGVGAGSTILDVPCGIGRWSHELASKGYRVRGLDFSKPFVDAAARAAGEKGVGALCGFKVGDMREVARLYEGSLFDGVLNLFTSIGYYDEATDSSVVSQLREVTRPGGVLMLETGNRDAFIRGFQPRGFMDFGDVLRTETRVFDSATSRLESTWTYYVREGGALRHARTVNHSLRLYGLHELLRLVAGAGWAVKGAFSGFDKAAYSWDRNRIIVVAVNPA